MKASEIIEMLQEAIDEHGDQDTVIEHEGWGYDLHPSVDFSEVKAGIIDEDGVPNCFVISINN